MKLVSLMIECNKLTTITEVIPAGKCTQLVYWTRLY